MAAFVSGNRPKATSATGGGFLKRSPLLKFAAKTLSTANVGGDEHKNYFPPVTEQPITLTHVTDRRQEHGKEAERATGSGGCGCRCGGDIVVAMVAFPEPSTLRTAPRMLRGLSGVALLLQEERTRKVLCAVCVPPM